MGKRKRRRQARRPARDAGDRRLRQPVRKAEADLEAAGQRMNVRAIGMGTDHRVAIDRLGTQTGPPLDHLGTAKNRCKRPRPSDQPFKLVVRRGGIVEPVLAGAADRRKAALMRHDIKAVEVKQRQRRIDIPPEQGRLPLDRLAERFLGIVRATIKGLESMHSPAKIAAKRGKKVEDLVNG